MKSQHSPWTAGFALVALVGLMLLSSCVSFNLVSQRPAPGAVDATSGASTAEAPAQVSSAEKPAYAETTDADTAATE